MTLSELVHLLRLVPRLLQHAHYCPLALVRSLVARHRRHETRRPADEDDGAIAAGRGHELLDETKAHTA